MSLIEQLKNEGVLEGYWDFRSGSFRDWSGNDRDGTPVNSPYLNREGLRLDGSDQHVTCGTGAAIASGGMTLLAIVDLDDVAGFDGFIVKANSATNVNYVMRNDDGVLEFYWRNDSDSSNRQFDSPAGAVKAGRHCYAVTHTFGTDADSDMFVDGVSVGLGTAVNTQLPLSNTQSIVLGARDVANQFMNGNHYVGMIISRVLTSSEVAQLTAELNALKWPSKVSGKAKSSLKANPNDSTLIGVWGMKKDGVTVVDDSGNNDGTASGGESISTLLGDGMHFDGIDDIISTALSINPASAYTFSAFVKLDDVTSSQTFIGTSAQNGIQIRTSSANLQVLDGGSGAGVVATATDPLKAGVVHHLVVTWNNGAVEIFLDNVSVASGSVDPATYTTADLRIGGSYNGQYLAGNIYEVSVLSEVKDSDWIARKYARGAKAVQFKTDFGATESPADVTAGFIENTPFTVDSGTWKVSSDTIDGEEVKVIECVTDGVINIPSGLMNQSPSDAAFGTWEFWSYKGSAGNAFELMFCASVGDIANSDGYYWLDNISELDVLRKRTSGSNTNMLISGVSFNTAETWYRRKITRDLTGVITVYRDGVLVANDGGGTNPTTADLTHLTSNYVVVSLDAGDKIALADRKGDHALTKYLGVV